MEEHKEETIWVKCTFLLPVTVPITEKDGYNKYFDIEENHCPGTGRVGAVLDDFIKRWDKEGYCWACALGGKNEIVDKPDWGDNLLKYITSNNKNE